MKAEPIKNLIVKYGLPLDIKKEGWFGDYYFRAEKLNGTEFVSGQIYKDGLVYQSKSFSVAEKMQLCHKYAEIGDDSEKQLPNPNGLDTNKSHYIKGVTELFVNKKGRLATAYFERFDRKNGSDVIYVLCEGESNPGFYSFPNTTYVFPNKDDANRAIDKANRNYTGTLTSNSTIVAFQSLPKAQKPSVSETTETKHEKSYHESVDRKLSATLCEPQADLENGQHDLSVSNNAFREELSAAREDGYMLDDHAYISHNLNSERANQKIAKAEAEISRIEGIRKKPYFARIDCGKNASDLHTAYIGDCDIPGYVVDWRHTEIGNAYYNASLLINRDDIFLALKRIITINMGRFDGYDDVINFYHAEDYRQSEIEYAGSADDLLTKLLSESRLDKTTHDIIKTIQGEQYDIITSDFRQNIVINGCAGSGKTMIMYHRLSYMAYNYETVLRRKFDPNRVYIISPSSFFDSSNNELMKKLSIDKVRQASFRTQVEDLIGEYCSSNGIFQFQGIIALINAKGTFEKDFYNGDSFNDFMSKLEGLDKDEDNDNEYNRWIIDTVNNLLDMHGFKKISSRLDPMQASDVTALLFSPDYYLNECFLKKGQKTDTKSYYSPSAITTISYENVLQALSTYDEKSSTFIQRQKRINKHLGMLKVSLSLKTKTDSDKGVYTKITEFWNLVDNATAFEKMLLLVTVQKLLECVLVPKTGNNDYILKCLFIYQKYFTDKYATDFDLYVLKAMSKKFGEVIKEDTLIFVDEFQNYSSFELACLKSAFAAPVFNLFGDYDQRIEDKGTDLRYSISSLLSPNTYSINVNYRNARQITEYINKSVHKNMQSIGIDGSVEENILADCVFEIRDRTAIICNDVKLVSTILKGHIDPELINNVSSTGELIEGKFGLMTVSDSKGLEFETVYVLDYGMSENEKYVAYTRALDRLVVISEDLEKLRHSEESSQNKSEEARRFEEECLKAEKTCISEEKLKSELYSICCQVYNRSDDILLLTDAIVKLESIIDWQSSRQQIVKIQNKISHLLDEQQKAEETRIAEEKRKNELYSECCRVYNRSDDVLLLTDAIVKLESIIDWQSSRQQIVKMQNKISHLLDEQQKAGFRAQKCCQYCGGKFKGLFSKKCRACGRKKDY